MNLTVVLVSQLTSHQAKISNQECLKCRECPHCSGCMSYFWHRGWWLIINFPVAWKRMNDLAWNKCISETTQPLHHGRKSKICVIIKTLTAQVCVCDYNMLHVINGCGLVCSRIEEEEWDKYIIPSKTESEKYKVSRTFSFIKSRMYSTRNKNKVNIHVIYVLFFFFFF